MRKVTKNQKKRNILRASAAIVLALGFSACGTMHNHSDVISGIPVTVPDGKTYHIRNLNIAEKDGVLRLHGHVFHASKHKMSTAEHMDIAVLNGSGTIIEAVSIRLPKSVSYFNQELNSDTNDVSSVEVRMHLTNKGH